MIRRAAVARGLRLLASLVAGDDPAALALSEALRAQGEARRALDAAERTRGVVAAMLREGVARAEAGLPSVAVHGPTLAARALAGVEAGPLPAVTVARGRELLREVEGER